MDLIVMVCRTLASRPRLQLLRAIYAQPDLTVNAAAAAIGLAPNTVSRHLKLLNSFHFIRAVPSGRCVRQRPASAGQTSQTFLRAMQHFLQKALVLPAGTGTGWQAREDVLMKLFTTYTHLRRLLLLRKLAGSGASTSAVLAADVGMSNDAAERHLEKLLRRRIVTVDGTTPPVWRLATAVEPALRRRLLRLILRALSPEKPDSIDRIAHL